MKKMKKLNLNKIRIVSLKNLLAINGGSAGIGCIDTNTCPATNQTCPPTISYDNAVNCDSTGITYGGNDGGTLKSADAPSYTCSQILTGCEIRS